MMDLSLIHISFDIFSLVIVVESVYNYIISNFKYDYDKAKNVKSGYLPDVDKVFTENTGVCSVSYTHLDVYKRQVLDTGISISVIATDVILIMSVAFTA